ncbi:uncharacterized protein [Procambarus clarkii]|uniref:uncharacterized protein n=1 Tax=Procambarus clarkii TaxID=6728 RepID=UPI003742D9E8
MNPLSHSQVFVAALLTLQLLRVGAAEYMGDRVISGTRNVPTGSRRWRDTTLIGRDAQDPEDRESSPPNVFFDSSWGKSKSSSSSGLTDSQVVPQVRSRVLQGTGAGGGPRTRPFVSQYRTRKGKERPSRASRRDLLLHHHRNRTITMKTRGNSSVHDQRSDAQQSYHTPGLHNVTDKASGNLRLVKNTSNLTKEHLDGPDSNNYDIYTHNDGGFGDKEFPEVSDGAHTKGLEEIGRPSWVNPREWENTVEKDNTGNLHDKNTQTPQLEYVTEVGPGVDRSCSDLGGCGQKFAWKRPEDTSTNVILPFRTSDRNKTNSRAFSDHQDQVEMKSKYGQLNGQASNNTSDLISSGRQINKEERLSPFDSATPRKNKGTAISSVNTTQAENTHTAATTVPPERDSDSVEVQNSPVILISIRGKWNETTVTPLSSRAAGNHSIIMESSVGPGYNGVNNEGVKFYKSFPLYSSAQSESSATKITDNELMVSGPKQNIEENGYEQRIKEHDNFTSQWETQVYEPRLRDALQYFNFNRNVHENRPNDEHFHAYKTTLMPDQDVRKDSSLKEITTGTRNMANSSPGHHHHHLHPAIASHLSGVNREVAGGDDFQSQVLGKLEQDRVLLEQEDLHEGEPNRIKKHNLNVNFGGEESSIYDSRASLGKDGVYHHEEGAVGRDVSEENEREIGLFSYEGDESFFASFERFFEKHELDANTSTDPGYERTRSKDSSHASFSNIAGKQKGKEQSGNKNVVSHQDHINQQVEIKHHQHDRSQQRATPPQPQSSFQLPIFGSRLPSEDFNSLNDRRFSPLLVSSKESFSTDEAPQEPQIHEASNQIQSFKAPDQFYVNPETKFPPVSVIPGLLPSSRPSQLTPPLQPFNLKDSKYNQDIVVQETRSALQEHPHALGDVQTSQQGFPDGSYFKFHKTHQRNLSNNITSYNLHENEEEGHHQLSVPGIPTATSPAGNNLASLQSTVIHPTSPPILPLVLNSFSGARLPYPPPPPPPPPPPYTVLGRNRIQESQPENTATLFSLSNRPDPPLPATIEESSGQSLGFVEWATSYPTKPNKQPLRNGSINAATRPVNGKLSAPQENRAVRVNVDNRRPQGGQKSRSPILYQEIRRPSEGDGSGRPHSRLKNGRRVAQGKRPSRHQGPNDNRKPINYQRNSSFANSQGNTHGQDTAGKKKKKSRPGRPHQISLSPPHYHLRPPPANSDNSKIPHREDIQEYRHDENKISLNETLLHNENRNNFLQVAENGADLRGSQPTQTNDPMSSFQNLSLLPKVRPRPQFGPTRTTRGSPSPRHPSSPSLPSPPTIPPAPSSQYTPPPRYNSFGLLFQRPPPRQSHHDTGKPSSPTLSYPISSIKPQTTSSQIRGPRTPKPHPGREVLNIGSPLRNGNKFHNKNLHPAIKSESTASPGRGNLRFRPGKEIENGFRPAHEVRQSWPLYEVSQPLPSIPSSDDSRMSESHAEMMKNMRYGLNGEPLNIWIPI